MKANDFLSIYTADGLVKTLAAGIKASDSSSLRIKGLQGSLDAVLIAACFKLHPQDYWIVLQEREEANYFLNDLQNLLGREILFFPLSYRRPYEYDEIENANVLQRTETLNKLATKTRPEIVITYPEALGEKVITRRSLSSKTFTIKKGEQLDVAFLEEFLHDADFEKTDFVYEAGQLAVRGGIVDVYSFSHELPYRIELFGNEVDSIRSFEPGSQLSVETLEWVNLVPNLQNTLVKEERQSLLEFIAPQAKLWFKD